MNEILMKSTVQKLTKICIWKFLILACHGWKLNYSQKYFYKNNETNIILQWKNEGRKKGNIEIYKHKHACFKISKNIQTFFKADLKNHEKYKTDNLNLKKTFIDVTPP